MKVTELSKEEFEELKRNYLDEKLDHKASFLDLYVNIDELITNEEVISHYEGTEFVKDDFFCNQVENLEFYSLI